jgi:hypothetical protein
VAQAKLNRATDIVKRAQNQYPKNLAGVKAYFGDIPYGVEVLDRRAVDKRLMTMTPDQMIQLAQTDPMQAERVAARIQQLQARSAATPPLPGQDDTED